ncbi:hypothetical protein ZWY2020_011687 [Hordeum vulgare]|nr:hypothetical protein ZWY2020_011687 [Hordeum vulgare]
MAELASGAVGTLLGVISHEALRLGRVRHDVQFIQEEMESMGSFLANLSGNSREHDEQVRTWMNQVRILANDCNNCIDLYLYRGDPGLHLPKEGPGRYLLWAPWLLRKLLAQHRAAGQLRELKDRAQDIGNRRLRYGVEVKPVESSPSSQAGQLAEPSLLPATQDHEEEEDDDHHQDGGDPPLKVVALSMTSMKMNKEDYFRRRLDNWMVQSGVKLEAAGSKPPLPSITFVVIENRDADALQNEALDVAKAYFKRAEDEKNNGVPRDTDPAHEDKAVTPEIKDADALTHEDKAAVPSVSKDVNTLCSKIRKIRKETMGEIKTKIKTMDVNKKLQDIKICNLEDGKEQLSELQKLHKRRKNTEGKSPMGEETLEHIIGDKSLDKLLWLLIYHSTTTATSEKEKKSKSMVAELYNVIIKNTAIKLGNILEKQEYENILREVFPNPKSTTTASNSTPRTLVDDIIKDMVKKEVKEMLHELRVDKSDKNPETGSEEAQTAPKDDFQVNTDNKKEEIVREIMKQLKIKMVAQKIIECLRDNNQRILVILKVSDKYVPQWEETRNSLSLLGSNCPISGAVIVAKTTQDDTRQYFGCPGLELIEYSPVGLYFDIVLQVTSQYINDHRVLHDILCKCKPHEFCMKIFAHALYAKPKRSSDELKKLHDTLRDVATQKSLPSMMFKFSYRDLPKEYRSCLLYLAIFPQGQTVRRSTLIGRWVAEGMITTKEWSWPSSVVEAEKCFDTLVARCLVCPADIDASGKVKSCMVDKLVYGFITKIAIKQRILETRLSHHLAHHFSIFSDVRLRSSEKIENFLKKSSQFSKLKVLDLEGCVCFPEYQHYLTDICRKILMLKYLSLRGTGVTRLPSEINNLLELEVLDIRETEIPASATRNVLLRKLKRLLAGKKLKDLMASQSSPADKTEKVEVLCNAKLQNVRKRLSPSHVDSSPADYFSVQIPGKIEKMLGVEVLANLKNLRCVKLRHSAYNDSKLTFNKGEFKNLNKFLVEGNNMTEIKFDKGAASNLEKIVLSSTNIVSISGVNCLQKLEELELKGVNDKKMVHSLFDNAKHIAKVTLRDTMLEQGDLKILAGNKKMRYLALLGKFYNDRHLIFEDEFQNLNLLTVDSSESDITEISFTNSSPNLEKIVWSSKEIVSLSGINKLPALKELELNGGDSVPNMLEEETKKRKIRLDYKPTDKPKKIKKNKREADKSLWKVKDWCWSN